MRSCSVIIPAFNLEKWIAEAIGSVDDIPGIETEIIVVDDGSTDRTLEVIERIGDQRVRVIQNSGKGPGDARNVGLSAARGEVIFALDGDDRFAPGARAKLLRSLQQRPDIEAVARTCRYVDEKGELLTFGDARSAEDLVTDEVRKGRFLHLSTLAIRAETLRRVGWQRGFFQVAEDRDFLFRFSEQHDILGVPVVVTEIRIRASSIGRTKSVAMQKWFREEVKRLRTQRRTSGVDDLMLGKTPVVPEFEFDRISPIGEVATRLMIGEGWRLRSSGRVRDAWSIVARAFRRRWLLPYVLVPGLKLGLFLIKDQLSWFGRPRVRTRSGEDRAGT